MQKMRLFSISLIIIISLTITSFASNLEFSGELNQGINYDFEDGEFSSSNIQYYLELERELGYDGKVYISFDGNYDVLNQFGEINLDEAYTSIYLNTIDLTVGQQVINWGTADGINPTNNINPNSINSLTNGEGKPLLSAQATFYGSYFSITGVVIPDFVPQDLIDFSTLVKVDDPAQMALFTELYGALVDQYDHLDVNVPNTLDSLEYALQGETRVGGYDLKLSYFYGWEDLPAITLKPSYNPEIGQSILVPFAQFRRVNKLGLATAGSYETVGVWGEAAYIMPEEMNLSGGSETLSMNESYLQAVVGSDYTFSNGVYLEGQYLYYGNGSILMPYNLNFPEKVEPGHYLMNHLSYEIDQDHKVELTSIIDIVSKGGTVMPAYIWSLNQSTELKIKPIMGFGEESEFGNLSEQLAIELKTNF